LAQGILVAQAAPTPRTNPTSILRSSSRANSPIMQSATTRGRICSFSDAVDVREFEQQEFEDSEIFFPTADCDTHEDSSDEELAIAECIFRASEEKRHARRSATGSLGQTIVLPPILSSKILQRRVPRSDE